MWRCTRAPGTQYVDDADNYLLDGERLDGVARGL
jgi:hypothetical protein